MLAATDAHGLAVTQAQILGNRVHTSPPVKWYENQCRNDHRRNGTNPFEIGLGDSYAVSVAGSTDIAVGIDIGANDREPDNPPCQGSACKKKILCGFDALAKANANEGDKSHVNDDDCKINGVQSSLP